MLGNLGVVVHGQLHVREVIYSRWAIEIHDIAADPVFRDLASRETLVQLTLLSLCQHIVIDWTSRQIRDPWKGL